MQALLFRSISAQRLKLGLGSFYFGTFHDHSGKPLEGGGFAFTTIGAAGLSLRRGGHWSLRCQCHARNVYPELSLFTNNRRRAANGPRSDIGKHLGKRSRFDPDRSGERSIDGDDNQQFRKDQHCKESRHRDL